MKQILIVAKAKIITFHIFQERNTNTQITILSNYESLTFLPITSIIRLIFLSRELNKYKQDL